MPIIRKHIERANVENKLKEKQFQWIM